MSLILDALRKMEQERKSRLGTSVDIRPEVLRYRSSAAQPPARKPYLQGAVALVLVAAGIGTGVYLKGGKSAAEPEATVAAVAQPVTAPQPSAPPVAPQAVAPQGAAPQPAPVAQLPPAPQPPAAAAPAPPKAQSAPYAASVPVERSGVSTGSGRHLKAQRVVEAPQAQTPVEDLRGSGDITVSGIAWQEERSLRRAVVNGALVGEGAEVAGARVVEIRETRVRFSRGGQSFDVSYTSN